MMRRRVVLFRGIRALASHSAYCDESNYNTGAYPSIGVVSLHEKDRGEGERTISEIIRTSGFKELKWKELASADARKGAVAVAKYVVALARAGRIRVDALSWSAGVPSDLKTRRRPTEELEVKYYWILKTVLTQKWPHGSAWNIVADQQSAIDWDLLHRIVAPPPREVHLARADDIFVVEPQSSTTILSLSQCSSHAEPLVQVADLFAGVAGFSREHAKRHARWSRGQREDMLSEKDGVSRSHRARFEFMTEFKALLDESKIDVHLWRDGFETLNPSVPINFWHWKPVRVLKAPQRSLALW